MTRAFSALLSTLLFVVLTACGSRANPDQPSLVDKAAPKFSAKDQDGVTRTLKDYQGQFLVLYFYPKDGTPGCTKEACAFRDSWDAYKEKQVAVVGISQDSSESHREFADEHDLDFPLLADEEGRITKGYNVASRLGMSSRVSFLIDPSGHIVERYDDVDPGVHAQEILDDVNRHSTASE